MPEKAAGSGAHTLEVPVDASAISADDLKQQNLKVVVRTCEGELFSEPLGLKADGTGSARFSFKENPGAVSVLVGPDRAEDRELADAQTLTGFVSEAMWAKRQVVAEPIVISYYWWWWWWRWCREFTIHGRVVCADGRPVSGAEVCAYDVDWWWWWLSKQQVGCAFTDASGSFDIKFRWCCGFWPWWWWRYRIWDYHPPLAEAIMPVLERDPRIELGPGSNVPNLEVFKPLLSAGFDASKTMDMVAAGTLDQVRSQLLEKLPAAPELAALRIWPWSPWWPWWDCTPDIIFRVTQDCRTTGTVIVDEGYGDTRWDIPDPLNVTLVANDLACCRPKPPCHTGDCIEIANFCSDLGIGLSDVAGNPGAPAEPAALTGFYVAPVPGNGDRPFSGLITVEKANDFAGVDYYGVEYSSDGGGSWSDLPAGAYADFCRTRLLELPLPPTVARPKFKWLPRTDEFSHSHTVVESREHYEQVTNPVPFSYWELGSQLLIPINSGYFPDGNYLFHVVGYEDDGAGGVKNGHVLNVCGTDTPGEWTLTFDNAIPDPSVPDCGGIHVRQCWREPLAMLNSITINGAAIPACGVSEINGDLVIDFEASDASGHLGGFDIAVHYGAGIVKSLFDFVPFWTLTNISADHAVRTYADALTDGATRPIWTGGRMRFTIPAYKAFPEPCCYLIRLDVSKRHVLGGGDVFSSCSYGCEGVWWKADEFTVGAGVCDPAQVQHIELPSAADVAAVTEAR
jgi:hypothetical protein